MQSSVVIIELRFTAGRELCHPALITWLQIFALHCNCSIMTTLVFDLQKLLLMWPRNGQQSDPATPGVTLPPIDVCSALIKPSKL